MISSKVFQLLVGVGLGLGALTAAARAGVFQASTTVSVDALYEGLSYVSLPQYSGPGTITGVNLALSGTATGTDYYAYYLEDGITVPSYSSTWNFWLYGPQSQAASPSLVVSATAHYMGGSAAPCTDPLCNGALGYFYAFSSPTPFSGSANLTDLSDFMGSGTNSFSLEEVLPGEILNGSGTVTETILTSVPEPSTWTMALIGFAMVGFAAHARRLASGPRRAV